MEVILRELLFLSYIYLFCFLGALSKDLLETFLGNTDEILVMKIIVSSLAVAIVLYGVSDKLIEKIAYKPFTALCYIMGLVSFEVLVRYSSMRGVGDLIEEIYRIKWDKNKDKG